MRFFGLVLVIFLVLIAPKPIFGQFACTQDFQCSDQNPDTVDLCVRPGASDSGCTNLACNPICLSDSDCDDGDSTTLDVCAGAGRCSAECVNLSSCGNGVLDPLETPCTCPQDAGSCSGSFGTCGENACIGDECKETIKLGCCGNNICEFGETYSSCSVDCKPQAIEIEIVGVDEGTFFVRGENALIKVKLTADGVPIKNAIVTLNGFFGELKLFNDGDHGDEQNDDEFYANYLGVPLDIQADSFVFTVNAVFDGQRGIKDFDFVVVPALDIWLSTDKENYLLGESINISGIVSRKTTAIKTSVLLEIFSNNLKIFEKELETNDLGEFDYSYRTSFLENAGDWKISVFSSDEFENSGLEEKIVNLSDSQITSYLELEVLQEIKETYNRGDLITLSFGVFKASEPVSGAQVNVVTPDNQTIVLQEKSTGVYEGEVMVGLGFPLGSQVVRVNALKKEGENSFFAGTFDVSFSVQKVDLELEVLEPRRFSFQVGEEIEFLVRVFYPNKKPVAAQTINATVNENAFELTQVTKGVYSGKYLVAESDQGVLLFEALVDDGFENKGETSLELEVSGVSFLHYFRKYYYSILLLGLGVLIAIFLLGLKFLKQKKETDLQKEQKIVLDKIKNVQLQYFKEGTLDKKNYDKLIEKHQSELDYISKTLEQLKASKKK